MQKSTSGARTKVKELEPFNKRSVDIERFKPDLSEKKLASLFGLPPGFSLDFLTIDALGIARTVGRGRTNLTFIRPTIVQADAATPFASFDRRESPNRKPAISMHFEPSAYGITGASSFLMIFSVECFGQSTFTLDGFAGSGTLSNNGTKTLNGKVGVTLEFNNVAPGQQTFGFLEQSAGTAWNFFTARVRFPFPILVNV
ncbi:MAG: hypothetical protein LC780_17185 [Acidobacteria bacterium]|nr:hypothetical protein [Acidobacteriota bacterium]